jgi:hypothetical protein
MKEAQTVFEAIMRSNGHKDFKKSKTGLYLVPGLQTRWKYFLLGWEMRGVK